MGHGSDYDPAHGPLLVQYVRFSDGCYDPSGTYWGMPANLWCGFVPDTSTEIYVRAFDRDDAKLQLVKWVEDLCGETPEFRR